VVRIDPRLADLVAGFLDGARRDIALARTALDARDLEAVRLAGHTLFGSAGSYGFEAIARLGGLLEHAARNGDIETAGRIVARAADYLANVRTRMD
jgi:HPt (histidine-containing phosphotransfer) domain-containing protein